MTLLNGMTFDEFWPIDDASSLKDWCRIHIDAMGSDAATMIYPAITNALGISVTIIFLSRQDGTFKIENEVNCVTIIDCNYRENYFYKFIPLLMSSL